MKRVEAIFRPEKLESVAASLDEALAWADAARIASARVLPAQEYTRVIVEAPVAIPHEVITLRDPNRVVLELQGATLTAWDQLTRSLAP